ncbi:MAG: hypothetical protein ENTB_01384 [Enterocloster aldenensis]
MINAVIYGDGKGNDDCTIRIEEEYSEDGLIHLFAQLKELNDTVLMCMIKHGFDPNDISRFAGAILLHTLTDFRKSNNITG